ncbi:methionyl-tRNA formyltransferase [Bacillus sp. JCM 19046]|nr:methionyl-tRNA formyltransferase [Bacillus sp. JCM 19046]
MKIVFMGTPAFAVPILRGLINRHQVVAVVTQPDRPVGRKRVLTPSPVKIEALEQGIPVIQPEKIRNEYDEIVAIKPDLIVTAAYGQLVPNAVLEAPKHGCINVHASLLPKYRGGAPIHQAIIDGEAETGISIMYMAEKLDAGDVLRQQAIPIGRDDDVQTMHDKLSVLGLSLLEETLEEIATGKAVAVAQDHSKATFAPNIKREQEVLDWNKTAEELNNQIRGMRPWPVAYTTVEQKRLKVWQSVASKEETDQQPGEVIEANKNGLYVACGQGTVLCLTVVQPAGKKPMDAKQLWQQFPIGIKLGENNGES